MMIMVTGGAGYIGSHAVRLLGEAGYEVLVYDHLHRGHREAVAGFNLIEGDTADTERVSQALAQYKVDAVMHFAAYSLVGESVEQPGLYYRNNVVGGLSLLEAAIKTGVKYFIFSSSAAVYGEPDMIPIKEIHARRPVNPYGETKVVLENALSYYCRAYGLKYISLRYFNAAGASLDGTLGEDHDPESHLIPLILQVAAGKRDKITICGDDYPTPDGTTVRDYIHVEDLSRAHVLALEVLKKGKTAAAYNLGNGNGYSVWEVIKTAEKVAGRPLPYKIAPRRPGDPAILVASSDKAKQELGWEPRYTSLASIISTAWRWEMQRT